MQTFKPGDWVHFSWGKPFILTEKDYKYFKDCNTLYLWQPKQGELVILKDKNGIVSIIKYNGETDVYPFIGEITWLHKKD